jgi:hypothetical protein
VPAYRFLWSPHDEFSEHVRRYTAGEIRGLMDEAGLEVRRLSYFNMLLFPPVAVIRLASRLTPRGADSRFDCEMTRPGRANAALSRVFASEAGILDRVNLPVGLSILALGVTPTA